MTEREALKLALEALKYPLNQSHKNFNVDMAELLSHRAITAIEEVLAQPEREITNLERHERNVQQLFGERQPEQEPKCNPHPKAPHGFNRNASHANDRYTCECESWDAYDAGYQAGVLAGIETSMGEPKEPEQEPVAFLTNRRQRLNVEFNATGLTLMPKSVDWKIPLYTTPPQRTWVGLTPEEVEAAIVESNLLDDYPQDFVAIIEAKLKEKNT